MEAVLQYEDLHQVAAEERVGYIDMGKKAKQSTCGTEAKHAHDEPAQERPVKWVN